MAVKTKKMGHVVLRPEEVEKLTRTRKAVILRLMNPQPEHFPRRKAARWEWSNGKPQNSGKRYARSWRDDEFSGDECQHCGFWQEVNPLGKFGETLLAKSKSMVTVTMVKITSVAARRVDGKWRWEVGLEKV